ncbi:lysozyme inhibitor LprI family protein [Pectobacterium versatile]|uniref:lysozyme inhibitor LprI family protein n=1 Tax=Pectobacterium versatile TaxID=2488639 RepID=UPI001CD0F2F8|nr:lysozyme inhibitor LprI family protein [Pectobacterium versatile]
MKNIYFYLLVLFSVNGISPAFGDIYLSKLDVMEKTLCKDLMKEGGYNKVDLCINLMLSDSTEKLEKRNKEITDDLSKLESFKNFEDLSKFLKMEQAAWKDYIDSRCSYKQLVFIKDSPIYFSSHRLCHAVENYRRIESLEGELNIP